MPSVSHCSRTPFPDSRASLPFGILLHTGIVPREGMLSETVSAAQAFGLYLQLVSAVDPTDLDHALIAMTRARAELA